MTRKKPKWLDRLVSPAGPFLVLCLTEEATALAYKKLNNSLPPNAWCLPNCAKTHIFNEPGKVPACIVCLRDWEAKAPTQVAGLLVHEAVHVWQAHREDIGEDRPGHEQEAYGIQFIAETLMEDFARQMKEMGNG